VQAACKLCLVATQGKNETLIPLKFNVLKIFPSLGLFLPSLDKNKNKNS
jgi:hypothetical protein